MKNNAVHEDKMASLVLLGAIIFGAWFRILPAWMAGFPINDGGMFYTMILELQQNNYAPPLFTHYNNLQIPYAYPPLGFYLAAVISDLLDISVLEIVRWLPGIISALCVRAFYFYAKAVTRNHIQAAVATLIFAFIPHLTSWPSMGGGLTRSFGLLFMLMAITYIHRVFADGHTASTWGAILFGSLTALSHTEMPLYTIAIAFTTWMVKSRSAQGFQRGAVIALGVLAVAGPWFGLVIARHGIDPFVSILQTGGHSATSFFRILNINHMTEEPFLGILGAMGVLGIAYLTAKKDFLLPAMLVAIFLADPRSAHVTGNIPLSIAGGVIVLDVVIQHIKNVVSTKSAVAFLAIIAFFLFGNSLSYGYGLSKWRVSEFERTAMQWIELHTPQDATFLVLTGNENPFCDPVNEWFPALTKRSSLTTVQGTEWLVGDQFWGNLRQVRALQACADEGIECYTIESDKLENTFEFVFISMAPMKSDCQIPSSANISLRSVGLTLENTQGYSVVYRSSEVMVFERNK